MVRGRGGDSHGPWFRTRLRVSGFSFFGAKRFFFELEFEASGLREDDLHFLNVMGFFGRVGFCLILKPLA